MLSAGNNEGSDACFTAATVSGHHQCPVCFKCYKRREHLQRHCSTHSSERPYRCASCECAFQRADVLKRHLRTCDGRTDGPPRTGTRRRACDRCVRQKRACNSRQPCQSCLKKAVECCYSYGPSTAAAAAAAATRRGSVDYGVPVHTSVEMDKDFATPDGDPMSATTTTLDTMMPFGLAASSAFNTFCDPSLWDYSSPTWQDFLTMTSESQTLREPAIPADANGRHHSFHFLDNFTSKTGLVLSFDCGTQQQREQVLSNLQLDAATCEPQQLLQLPGLLQDDILAAAAPPILEDLNVTTSSSSTAEGVPLSWLNDPLSLKTHQILLLIREVVMLKPRNSAVTLEWSPALEHACLQFFSPMSLRKFLGLYWAIWHPNVNFVHRPTFDAVSAKPILLASMAVIGACVSPDMADYENARMWFNCVEEMVFSDEDFFGSDSVYPQHSCGPLANRRKTQALQAAYHVCLYQNWEGTDASKSRIRRYRFATVVSVARDVGIPTARHTNYSQRGRYEFDWNDFVAREELIRTFLWIFLLDTAFVIFNNLPPRMVIKEMKMHAALPEACFQAATADQCYEQIQRFVPDGSLYWKVSFRCAFESLCKDHLTMDMRDILAALGPLNLFAVTSGIHSLIFQYRNSFGGSQLLLPIRNAISNWRDVWQLFASTATPGISPHVTVGDNSSSLSMNPNLNLNLPPEDMWKRVGFCRYSPEFWLLANLMMEKLSSSVASSDNASHYLPENSNDSSGFGINGQNNNNEFLESLDADGPLDPILNKYDQTSMRQVNDLILGFQKVQIR